MARREQQRAFIIRTSQASLSATSPNAPSHHLNISFVAKHGEGFPWDGKSSATSSSGATAMREGSLLNSARWAAPGDARSLGLRTAMELRALLLLPLCFPGKRRAGQAAGARGKPSPLPRSSAAAICTGCAPSWRLPWGGKGQPRFPPWLHLDLKVQHLQDTHVRGFQNKDTGF